MFYNDEGERYWTFDFVCKGANNRFSALWNQGDGLGL
jgi:hypothetical protein